MVDTTDAVLGIDDYFAMQMRSFANELEWANALTEQFFEPRNSLLMKKAFAEFLLGNERNCGQYLVKALKDYLMGVAQREYETYELGQPGEFDERPRKRP